MRKYYCAKCAHLLRDLAATADLLPNSALFSQQLLDLTHRWSEREDNDIDIGDVHPLATAQSKSVLSCTQRGIQIGFHTNSQTLSSLLAHRPTCPQPLLHSSPSASPTLLHCCTQLGQFRELSQVKIAPWGQSATSLAHASSLDPSQLSQRPLLSLVPPVVLARGAQDIADVYVSEQPFTMDSRSSRAGSTCVVPLVRVVDVSPSGRSVLEVTQRWLALSGARPPGPSPFFLHVCFTGDFCSLTQCDFSESASKTCKRCCSKHPEASGNQALVRQARTEAGKQASKKASKQARQRQRQRQNLEAKVRASMWCETTGPQ